MHKQTVNKKTSFRKILQPLKASTAVHCIHTSYQKIISVVRDGLKKARSSRQCMIAFSTVGAKMCIKNNLNFFLIGEIIFNIV